MRVIIPRVLCVGHHSYIHMTRDIVENFKGAHYGNEEHIMGVIEEVKVANESEIAFYVDLTIETL